MRLTFIRPHLSITAFPDIDLPRLTIVLGINGVGKSHLLEAIAKGNIGTDLVPLAIGPRPGPHPGLIRLLKPHDFPPFEDRYPPQQSGIPRQPEIPPFEQE